MLLKVGELAKRSGLTVRTLHHYDAIGLLKPSARSDAGYRLYNNDDVARLHAIQGLRSLGLPLSDIEPMLAVNGASLPEIIARQVAAIDQEIARAIELRARLNLLQDRLWVGLKPETNDWLAALHLMTTHGKYFSAAELKTISESWKQMEAEWQPLIQDVCAAAAQDLAPDCPAAQMLARRWMDLSMRWMKDDFDLVKRWGDMCRQDPAAYGQTGIDAASFRFIGRAIELRLAAFRKYLTIEDIKRLNKHLDSKWAALEQAAKKIIDQNQPPESAAAQRLAAQWSELMDQATDHDPVIREKLLNAVRNEPLIQAGSHLSPAARDFIRHAYVVGQVLLAG